MYVCATGSIPIAVALMMKGLTPGAALVLLMAGPACNVASMLVINKVLGRRTLLLYLTAIVGGAVLFGLSIDYLLPRQWFTSELITQGSCCSDEHLGLFSTICTVVLLLLLAFALFHHDEHDHEHLEEVMDTQKDTSNRRTFHIEGMHCSHCAANIEKAIRSIDGVEDVSVSLSGKSATITGDFDEEAARQAVEAIGFEVSQSLTS